MNDELAHERALGAFLRARREQLRPEDVGLRSGGRRRTPGLRREEVATLSGVSVDYLTRLEQGRDLKPSGAVVHALASTLRLTDDERMYLATLTLAGGAPELCPAPTPIVTEVAPNVRAMIDGLDPTPAFVTAPSTQVIAGNTAWRALVGPLGLMADDRPFLAEYVFTDPRARAAFTEWGRVADEQVSQLRAAALRWGRDASFAALLERLQDHDEFAHRWSAQSITEHHRGMTQLRHPDLGDVRVRYETLELPNDGDQRLTSWFAADEHTTAVLHQTSERAHLRVVRPA